MNKQKLIMKMHEAILNCKQLKYYDTQFEKGYKDGISYAIYLAEQLDEPEKPVVPKYVADFYESIKDDFENKIYELCLQYKHRGDELLQGVAWWFGDSRNKPIETLVKMKLYGYEVEKEKLYTVEIPNPNASGYGKTYLAKNKDGKVELYSWSSYTSIDFADNWKQEENAQLTESEIKQDFGWAFRWAKEVEE